MQYVLAGVIGFLIGILNGKVIYSILTKLYDKYDNEDE